MNISKVAIKRTFVAVKRFIFSEKVFVFLALVIIGLSVLVWLIPVFVVERLEIYPIEDIKVSVIGIITHLDVEVLISYTPYYLCVFLGFVFSAALLLIVYEITRWAYP